MAGREDTTSSSAGPSQQSEPTLECQPIDDPAPTARADLILPERPVDPPNEDGGLVEAALRRDLGSRRSTAGAASLIPERIPDESDVDVATYTGLTTVPTEHFGFSGRSVRLYDEGRLIGIFRYVYIDAEIGYARESEDYCYRSVLERFPTPVDFEVEANS